MEKVKFPVRIKTDGGSLIKKNITVNVIESDEVTFLCGEGTLVELRMTLYFGKRKLVFEEIKKEISLIKGSHLAVKLERVGRRRKKFTEEHSTRGGDLVKKIPRAGRPR